MTTSVALFTAVVTFLAQGQEDDTDPYLMYKALIVLFPQLGKQLSLSSTDDLFKYLKKFNMFRGLELCSHADNLSFVSPGVEKSPLKPVPPPLNDEGKWNSSFQRSEKSRLKNSSVCLCRNNVQTISGL